MKINSIKVFGERHTGTNAIGYFVGKNFNLKFLHYDFLGWKHRLAPKKDEWSKFDVQNCLFIFCIRNPYSWIQAMQREPYYDHYPKIKDLSLQEFVQFSIEDYENCIEMWNQKNDSYFRMSNEVPNSIIVNVEDFHADQNTFHKNLADLLNSQDLPLIKMNDYVNGRGRHEKKDIASSLEVPELDKSVVKIINSFLSLETMKKCNYKLLT
ncbi:hypothetical protein N9Z05_02850 [Gammaproteobacteria bacterium]|nr:hypothetical protein [Gammaproteobacteria bacterium]MDB2678314.1 hypothetical protein [Gammaproteobacteria bacterium]MDC3228132.1 hypothetical protein [Gammaproteobacteria bacterium]